MTIIKNKDVIKFGLYGLLKNLKFFEPFLWLYFLVNGLSLLEIGTLYAIREIIVYIFEIPSGVLADRFGRKNELVLCFVFYIMSFVMFFFSKSYGLFVVAISLYGLGEAFRSGTHKAMVMDYLEVNDMKESKTQVYGFTRSYSNIGSAISSVSAIILVLVTPDLSYLFLLAIIPYILDLFLVLSYPNYLNHRIDSSFNLKQFIKENIESVKYTFSTKKLNLTIVMSSGYNAVFKTIKDYIQPIFIGLSITFLLVSDISVEDNEKIYIGLIYFVVHFISIFATRYAYLLEKYVSNNVVIRTMWVLTALTTIVLGLFIQNIVVVILSFVLFYMYLNIRKPYMVEKIGAESDNSKRASVLSIESQITSLIIIVLAPLVGYISDIFGIHVMLISLGILMIVIEILFPNKKSA